MSNARENQLPDLVNSGTTKRAAFYRETFDFALATKERHPRSYLALYQTEFEEPLAREEYATKVRHSSDLFPKNKDTTANGDFDARNYKLMVDYDPKGTGESECYLSYLMEMTI